jgi:hypothetical protein
LWGKGCWLSSSTIEPLLEGHQGLGRPDRALARAREATALARRVNHSSTLVFPLLFETMVHRLRRDAAAQRERAAELIAVSETHGFPFLAGARAGLPRRRARRHGRARGEL